MQASFPTPDRTLLILIGAADFTAYVGPGEKTDRAKQAFANAAQSIWDLAGDSSGGLGIPFDNRLKLFDEDGVVFQKLSERIQNFIQRRDKALGGNGAEDIIIYYIGHGGFHNERYYLALKTTDRSNPLETGYPFEALAGAIKRAAPRKRKYFVLDCCYAAAAFSHLHQSAEPAEHVLLKAAAQFPERVVIEPNSLNPRRDPSPYGTALLCAVAKSNRAMLCEDFSSTRFTSEFVRVCRSDSVSEDTSLSLWSVCEEIRAGMQDNALLPQCHTPEVALGDISRLPLFRPSRRKPEPTKQQHLLPSVFETDVFASSESTVHCLVVKSEPDGEDMASEFEDYVRQSLDTYGLEISNLGLAAREATENRPVSASGSALSEASLQSKHHTAPVASVLPVDEAFASPGSLERAVEALCRADIVVFDVGGYQPGAMVLLGIRSVVRRGVTINARLSSSRNDHMIGDQRAEAHAGQPFNLQMLRVLDLSQVKGRNRAEMLGEKMMAGLKEIEQLPHYLDLPAFDAVRRLGVDARAYLPVGYERQILILCPFSTAYTGRNWEYIEEGLPPRLSKHFASRLHEDNTTPTRPASARPHVVRLIDLSSPRLVSQTLYEAIRTTDMCIVDWSELRANVMYELGVRLAVNPLGAIHICASDASSGAQPKHVAQLKARFAPISYRAAPGEYQTFDAMIDRFDESRRQGRQFPDCLVYEKIGAVLERPDYRAAPDVVRELVQEADLLLSDDESTGVSPILYHDVNRLIRSKASEAATERRIAAWLYMDRRHSLMEIARDRRLQTDYRRLAVTIRRTLSQTQSGSGQRPFFADLAAEISSQIGKLKATKGFAPLDAKTASLADVLAEVRVLIDEAKLDRSQGPDGVRTAIAQLKIAVKLLNASKWAAGIDPRKGPSDEQRRAAAQLADCLGMIGGNLRRLNKLDEALSYFKKGRKLEADEQFGIESTYNLGNALSAAVEAGSKPTSVAMTTTLKSTLKAMKRRTEGSRYRDRWAWADQGQCCLLLGDFAAAQNAYQRFLELGDHNSTVETVLPVLRKLHTALVELDGETAATVEKGIAMLEFEAAKQK